MKKSTNLCLQLRNLRLHKGNPKHYNKKSRSDERLFLLAEKEGFEPPHGY